MIQDIAPHKFNNQYDPEKVSNENSPVFVFESRNLLVKKDSDTIILPTKGELNISSVNYLFTLDGVDYYRPFHMPVVKAPLGFEFVEISRVRRSGMGPQEMMFLAYTAYHLDKWYKDNRFCGRCGTRTEHSSLERAVCCSTCGKITYPRINPAVIVAITNGDEILLTKYARKGSIAFYALVAGFTEIGETFEECVEREVMEEVGLKVKNIRYYKSQPWGVAEDILAGYFCDVDGDTTIKMDESELKLAQWVKREDIELQPDNYSLTNEMMTIFKNGTNI